MNTSKRPIKPLNTSLTPLNNLFACPCEELPVAGGCRGRAVQLPLPGRLLPRRRHRKGPRGGQPHLQHPDLLRRLLRCPPLQVNRILLYIYKEVYFIMSLIPQLTSSAPYTVSTSTVRYSECECDPNPNPNPNPNCPLQRVRVRPARAALPRGCHLAAVCVQQDRPRVLRRLPHRLPLRH